MTQIHATLPDGRTVDAPRTLGADFTAHALRNTPQLPGSPDLLLAREAVAQVNEEAGDFAFAAFARRGCYDTDEPVKIALAAIRLVRELAL